jgi:hypothetical protein
MNGGGSGGRHGDGQVDLVVPLLRALEASGPAPFSLPPRLLGEVWDGPAWYGKAEYGLDEIAPQTYRSNVVTGV